MFLLQTPDLSTKVCFHTSLFRIYEWKCHFRNTPRTLLRLPLICTKKKDLCSEKVPTDLYKAYAYVFGTSVGVLRPGAIHK